METRLNSTQSIITMLQQYLLDGEWRFRENSNREMYSAEKQSFEPFYGSVHDKITMNENPVTRTM